MSQPIAHRHDILILFEVTNGNPNGDPDAGNQPRVDAVSGRGLVSDVCLKRKVRNYVDLFPPSANGKGFGIIVKQGNVLNTKAEDAEKATVDQVKEKDKVKKRDEHGRLIKTWLCNQYYDIRTFGQVISTGSEVMKGSPHGQIRGPIQFSFGRSYDPITTQEITITRCVATKVEDTDSGRTMGQKYIVPYGLYSAKCYVSPAFAQNTGFDQTDYDLFIEALTHLFDHDRSAARGDMVMRRVYDFEHVGTQDAANATQNTREAMLGCAHAHELFESIKVDLETPGAMPQKFADYKVDDETSGWDADGRSKEFPGVVLHRRHLRAVPKPSK